MLGHCNTVLLNNNNNKKQSRISSFRPVKYHGVSKCFQFLVGRMVGCWLDCWLKWYPLSYVPQLHGPENRVDFELSFEKRWLASKRHRRMFFKVYVHNGLTKYLAMVLQELACVCGDFCHQIKSNFLCVCVCEGWYIINSMYLRSFLRTCSLLVTQPGCSHLLFLPLLAAHHFSIFCLILLLLFSLFKGQLEAPSSGQVGVSLCIRTAREPLVLGASFFVLHLNDPLLYCKQEKSRADPPFNMVWSL